MYTIGGVICHHGILGQEWGKRNGPPYPLGSGDHSASERKAGYKKSIGGGRNEELYNRKKSNNINVSNKVGSSNKSKLSSEQISKHRDSMAAKYEKKGDSKTAELYRNATDSQIEMDYNNRKKIRNAVIAGAAVVGVAAATVIIYEAYQNHLMEVAIAQARANPNKRIDDLMKQGISLNMADKIVKVQGKNSLLNDATMKSLLTAAGKDMDITLSQGSKLARVDYHKDFDIDKARKFIYFSASKGDNDTYKNVLGNRTGVDEGKFNYFMQATKDIRMPSYNKTREMLSDMYDNDAEFASEVRKGIIQLVRNNTRGLSDKTYEEIADGIINTRAKGYTVSAALAGNEALHSKIMEEFSKQGYNAMLDIHDIVDGVSKMPIIGLDKSTIAITGKEVFDELTQNWG